MNPFDHPEKFDEAFDDGIKALGEIVYYFQQLEEELKSIVAFMTNPEDGDIGRTVVCELSFKQTLHLAWSLAEHFYVVDRERFDTEWKLHLGRAAQAEQLRNSLLHSTYGVSWEESPVFVRHKVTAKLGKGRRERVEALDDEVLADYRARIGRVSLELVDYFSREFPDWRTREWHPNWNKQ